MTRQLFGTDGIRGRANQEPMTAATALKVAMATARELKRGDHTHQVVIGKDTRLSGYMLESALTAGFLSMGLKVLLVGPIPTPGIAFLTRSMRCDLGVMISASHNPFADNGIKLFGADGFKLSDATEAAIEAGIRGDALTGALAPAAALGRAERLDDALGRYIEAVKASFPRQLRLEGLKIVVDSAHGAAYRIAPRVFHELGADVVTLGDAPNGLNINEACGATHPEAMREAVIAHGADLGVALDGDADRLILADETGRVIGGDQIMALIGRAHALRGTLAGGAVVATVMSNLGLELFLKGEGIGLVRTPVGDRYVVETMRERGCNVGGEQSGHLILADHATTGDGLVAALQVLAVMVQSGQPASVVTNVFQPLPQLLRNVRFQGGSPLERPEVRAAIAAAEAELGATGRVLVRKSGTEPLIRVMAEGADEALVERVVGSICAVVEDRAEAAE